MSKPYKTGHKIPRMHGGVILTQYITPTVEQESQYYAIPMPTEQQMALVISALRMHTIIMHAGEYDYSELGNPDKVTEHWPMQSSIGRFFRDAAIETLDKVAEDNIGNPAPSADMEAMNEPQSIEQAQTLDDILNHMGPGWCGNPFCVKPNISIDEAKAAIEAIVRDIISSDQNLLLAHNSHKPRKTLENTRRIIRNELRAEQRLRASKYNLELEKE